VRSPHLLDTCSKTRGRSKKETLRLHKLNKPIRQPVKDDLPNVSSHSEDDGEWSSNIGNDDFEEGSSQGGGGEELSEDSDVEMPYETAPRPRRPSWDEDSNDEVQRLPIKLLDGQVKNLGVKLRRAREESSEKSDDGEAAREPTSEPREDATLGSRLGRRSVVDVVTTKSRKERIHAAKEQIASICQDIVGDPEDSVRRFCFTRIIIIQPHRSSFPYSAVCTTLA
jgi:nucleolar complex protein 3